MSEENSISSYVEADQIERLARRSSEDYTGNSFSFTDTLGGFINNREFSYGYKDYAVGRKSGYAYVWEVLSAIGQDVGETIYSGVLNYIDNVSNIDLCKVQALRSMISSFGLNYSVLNNIDLVPNEVRDLIDVLSINKKYLMQTDVMKKEFVSVLSNDVYVSAEVPAGAPSDMSALGYVDDASYAKCLSSMFSNLISSYVSLPYWRDSLRTQQPVYRTYGETLVKGYEPQKIQTTDAYVLKIRNNIDPNFDEKAVADNIEMGKDSLDNYSGVKRQIIEHELTLRSSPKDARKLESRYASDKEAKVTEYFDFLKNKFYGSHEDVSPDAYSTDGTYLQLTANTVVKLLDIDGNGLSTYHLTTAKEFEERAKTEPIYETYKAFDTVFESVVAELVDITLYIAKLREKIKLQLQKTNMKGTFNLLSYVINEYLCEFAQTSKDLSEWAKRGESVSKIINNLRKHLQSDVKSIEYYDTTEYFNISSDTTPLARNRKYVNDRYWEESEEDHNTNSGFAFASADISAFYCDVLNTKNKADSLTDFLSTLYSAGAGSSYIGHDSGKEVITSSEELSVENTELFRKNFGIGDYGTQPYYSHKNKTHSSYQIHPYLYNFILASNYKYPVVNAFYNDVNETLEDQQVLNQLSDYVGKYGEAINVAIKNQYDFSGYKSRYETSMHQAKLNSIGRIYPVIDYDGAFYPQAVNEYLADPNVISSLLEDNHFSKSETDRTFYEKYYAHLNLNQNQLDQIYQQLVDWHDEIEEIVSTKQYKSDVYDIYKYGRDMYDNVYILYKKYNSDDPSYAKKRDTGGWLWIRLADHPIAFPAVAFPEEDTAVEKIPAVDMRESMVNGKFGSLKNDLRHAFFDMEFDEPKRTLILPYDPTIDTESVDLLNQLAPALSGGYIEEYKQMQHASFVVCNINEAYDDDVMFSRLQLRSHPDSKTDVIYNKHMMTSGASGYAYIGLYKNGATLDTIFVKKTMRKDSGVISYELPNKSEIQLMINRTTAGYPVEYNIGYGEMKLTAPSTFAGNGTAFVDADVKFATYSNVLCFGTQMSADVDIIRNSPGMTGGNETTKQYIGGSNYETNTSGGPVFDTQQKEMCSFDRLENFIGLAEAQLDGSKLVIDSFKVYNLHGDPSYTPAYPGLSGAIDLNAAILPKEGYFNVQLLGYSNDIDNTIAMVNPSADVDQDIETLRSQIYGRIWEDYDDSDDTSFKMVKNDTLTSRAGQDIIEWEITTIADNSYIESQISALRTLMYNSNTYGKNPYFVGELSDISDSEKELSYMQELSSAEVELQGYPGVKVAGTYNFFLNEINDSEKNLIYNIKSISAEYETENRKLKIRFEKTDPYKASFIPANVFTVVFLNKRDIRLFEQYHMLDPFGVISAHIDEGTYIDHYYMMQDAKGDYILVDKE